MNASMVDKMRRQLTEVLAPIELEILDEGHKHIGHAGEGRGHFHVRIVSSVFAGTMPLKRHRMVYAALAELMKEGIHALSIDARAP